MELADVGSPDAIIAAILKQLPNMALPVPVDEIAFAVGIERIAPLETDGFEGALIAVPDKSKGVILVNQNRPRQRKRFSVSHEVGHFLIPTHQAQDARGFQCRTQDMRRTTFTSGDRAAQMEVEANRFAAHLLMPPPMFRRDLERLPGADIEHIIALASKSKYDVSKEAAARRYVEYHHEVCAAIVSREGKFLRAYRNSKFPFIPLNVGERVPIGSLTASYSGPSQLSRWEEQDFGNWLGDRLPVGLTALYEQVLLQSDGFRLTLLNVDLQDEEEVEDEERMSTSWQPVLGRR